VLFCFFLGCFVSFSCLCPVKYICLNLYDET
jgi:hypothetical protein